MIDNIGFFIYLNIKKLSSPIRLLRKKQLLNP